MIYVAHIAFALELLALASGAGLLFLATSQPGSRQGWLKAISVLIMVLAFASLICTGYFAWQTKNASNFGLSETPAGKCGMMQEGGKKCPMMEKMMGHGESSESMPDTGGSGHVH